MSPDHHPGPPNASPSRSTQTLVVSYLDVRRAIGAIGLALPVLLGPVGFFLFGVEIQDTLSSYYHTPLRDVFVGSTAAIAVLLFCYRGYDGIENWTANIGSVSALCLAFCPMDPHSDPLHQRSPLGYVHSASGGVFFLTLAFYSLYHFPKNRNAPDEAAPHAFQRNLIYRTSGIVILISMFAMGADLFLLPEPYRRRLNRHNLLFWMEWVAVWSFAAAWLTKGRAILADIAVDLVALPTDLLKRYR